MFGQNRPPIQNQAGLNSLLSFVLVEQVPISGDLFAFKGHGERLKAPSIHLPRQYAGTHLLVWRQWGNIYIQNWKDVLHFLGLIFSPSFLLDISYLNGKLLSSRSLS